MTQWFVDIPSIEDEIDRAYQEWERQPSEFVNDEPEASRAIFEAGFRAARTAMVTHGSVMGGAT